MSNLTKLAQKILREIDIVDVVSRYIPLKPAGRNFKGLCPFHREKTPSFAVLPRRQLYCCFGCGRTGDAVRFVMAFEHLNRARAISILAKQIACGNAVLRSS